MTFAISPDVASWVIDFTSNELFKGGPDAALPPPPTVNLEEDLEMFFAIDEDA